MSYEDIIHDRGRGPEIKGTRITVYDILDYALECWPPRRIAKLFNLRDYEVEAAIAYIREHTVEVLGAYIKILERSARGNPPELQAKLDANQARFRELVKQVNDVKDRADAEIQELIRKHRDARAKDDAHAQTNGGPQLHGATAEAAAPPSVQDLA